MFRPPRQHGLFSGPVLLLLLCGAVLWITISRRVERTGRAARPDLAEGAAADPERRFQAQRVGPARARTNRTEATPERPPPRERTAQGAPKPSLPNLAVAAQPPPGPSLGPGLTPTTVLQNMRGVFRQYSSRFGANPVGTNPEITSALNGGNPKQVVFVDPEDGLRINERGELIDNWGTPFFFHQLSAKEMEIHCAGPDRKMWTADDLVMK